MIKKACPICGNNLKGNERFKYYCTSCCVFFRMPEIMDWRNWDK